ncbi:ADP-heptose--lipooligosaccharide heptosyltransferase II [hydrothermal vent metagenome]|uniref:ADP-heptose--lipooligosaccharide heptosyltransferase II n=1 Tax=hydrothermal vent metagenome TaxID=652676 RepID=A0A3B1CAH7_9ZZZZ
MGDNILVLNHTRMGDLIQTTPLLRGLKEKDPDVRITMLANAKFAGILEFIYGVDELIKFDIQQFCPTSGEEPNVLEIYEYLDRLTADLKSRRFDTIINLSHSKLSAMLAWLIGAGDTRGFLSTPRGERLVHDPWLVYFTSFLAFRKYNRFNIVDLYMRGAGITPRSSGVSLTIDQEALKAVNERQREIGIKRGEIIVGIQAGASRKDRRWPPENFAKVADYLAVNRGAKIVLFGAPSEKELGDEVEAAMENKAINLIGATSLSELVGWIKSVDLLVTNDTGTMHIAAAVGTPIVGIFFTHARCEETGPYCQGAFILQARIDCAPCSHQTVCDHYSCLEYITDKDVIAASETMLDGKDRAPQSADLFARARIYFSRFHNDGGIEYEPAKREPLDRCELFAYLYRPIFNEVIPRWMNPEKINVSHEITDTVAPDLENRFSRPPERELARWIERALEGAAKLLELTSEGNRLTRAISSATMLSGGDDLKDVAARLNRLSEDLRTLSETHDALSPLVTVYMRRVENFEGDDAETLVDQAQMASLWLEKSTRLFVNSIISIYEKININGRKEPETAQAIGDKGK